MIHLSPEKIKELDYMIRHKKAPNPRVLAEGALMSERSVYDYLKVMKNMGAPIVYDRHKGYYYSTPVVFKFGFEKV